MRLNADFAEDPLVDVWFLPVSESLAGRRQRCCQSGGLNLFFVQMSVTTRLSSSSFDKPCTYTSVMHCKWKNGSLDLKRVNADLFHCKSATHSGLASCVCHLYYLQKMPISFFFIHACGDTHETVVEKKIQIFSFAYEMRKDLLNKSVLSTLLCRT